MSIYSSAALPRFHRYEKDLEVLKIVQIPEI